MSKATASQLAIVETYSEKHVKQSDQRIYLAMLSMAVMHGINKNVAHAKTMGMSEALSIDDDQWSTLLMSFFFGMIFSTILTAICCKQKSTDRILAYACAVSISSGCVTTSVGLTLYLPGSTRYVWIWLVVTRAVQGLCEGSFAVCMLRYCSLVYDADRIGRRIIILLSIPAVAAAIGAIYASAMIHVNTSRFANWQVLYFGKGLATVVLSGVIWTFLGCVSTKSVIPVPFDLNDDEERHVWHTMKRLCRCPAAWQWILINFALSVPSTSILLYAPQLVMGLGFNSELANVLTIFPYVMALLMFLLHLYVNLNGGGLQILIAVQFVGFVVYRSATPQTSKMLQIIGYSATILMTCSLGTTNVLLAKRQGVNFSLQDRRWLGLCSIVLSQSTGLLTSWTFRGHGSFNNDLAIGAIIVAFLASCLDWAGFVQGKVMMRSEKSREQSISTIQS